MTVTCGVAGCGADFANQRTLTQHHKTKHLGYRYFCSNCAYGPVSQSSVLSDHRKAHEGCVRSCGLELQPGNGFYYGGRPVALANLSHALLRIHFAAIGQPMDELGAVAPEEPPRLGEAVVVEQQQALPGADDVSESEDESEDEPEPLPQGFYCAICPPVAPRRYLGFDHALDLVAHILEAHGHRPRELPPYAAPAV